MNICIIGGGHIGTTLLCYIKHSHPEHKVSLYTRRPTDFSKSIKCNDIENNISYIVMPDIITNDASEAYKSLYSYSCQATIRSSTPRPFNSWHNFE